MISIIECDPRLTPPEAGWRYTARPEWCSPGESIWMRLSKFSFCNRMGMAELVRLFARDGGMPGTARMDLRSALRWDLSALAKVMETSSRDVFDAFCVSLPRANVAQAAAELRYCPSCLALGFHATWFQWHYVERCPVHDQALRRGCPQCDHPIAYALGRPLALSPLCCPHCGCDWVPSLARPGGRCSPLPARASARMRRWAAFAREAIKAQGPRQRDWSTGRYTIQPPTRPPARPHLLTMVNRLFDSPPPPLRALIGRTRCPTDVTLPRDLVLQAEAAEHDIDDHQTGWPNFSQSFFRHERLLRAARSRVFARAAEPQMRLRWLRLVLDGLVMPTDSISQGIAAALGWAITWFGSHQAAATHAETTGPALGLAGWLAHLPPRPPSIAPSQWFFVERNWLLQDLDLSVRAWQSLVKYMGTQRFYLLHGGAVHLPTLARRRAVAQELNLQL